MEAGRELLGPVVRPLDLVGASGQGALSSSAQGPRGVWPSAPPRQRIHTTTGYPSIRRHVYVKASVCTPLVALPRARVDHLELQHRKAIWVILGLPGTSHIAATLGEVMAWPLSLLLLQRGLHDVDRLHLATSSVAVLSRLRSRPHSLMGSLCQLYEDVVGRPPRLAIPPPPTHHQPLEVRTTLEGLTKRRSPTCTLFQASAFLLKDQLNGHLHIYTDGSVHADSGSATASCVILDLQR